MSALNERGLYIAVSLLSSGKPLYFSDLTKMFKVSERMIRKDIEDLLYFLKKYESDCCIYLSKGSISLNHDYSISKIEEVISTLAVNEVILSKQTRIFAIKLMLLSENEYITLDRIADYLLISKASAVNDIKEVKKFLESQCVNLESTIRGFKVIGTEFQIRKILKQELMNQSISLNKSLKKYSPLIFEWIYGKKFVYLYEQQIIDSVTKFIIKLQEELNYIYTDSMVDELFIYLLIQAIRMKSGKTVQFTQQEINDFILLKEYIVIKELFLNLCINENDSMNQSEVVSIVINVLGGSVIDQVNHDENYYDIQILTFEMIHRITDMLNIRLYIDYKMMGNLILHIKSMIFRMKFNLQLDNPLLNEIKNKYLTIFECVKKNIESIENHVGITISEDEIGFITLYFAALQEENRKEKKSIKIPKVLVVCNYGMGTVNLLITRLQKMYNLEIHSFVSLNKYLEMELDDSIDLIISTIQLPENKVDKLVVTNVVVDALLNLKDIEMLDQLLERKVYIDVNEIIKIVKISCNIINEKELTKNLADFLLKGKLHSERKKLPMLKDVIKPELVNLEYDAIDWEDAVRKSGEPLLKYGYVEQSYIDSMVETVKEVGPYIVITKGVALPHSRSSDNVKKIGISMLRLKNTVSFGNEHNDPVKLVFAICSIDSSSHLEALKGLAQLLMDKKNIEFLSTEKDIYEIIKFIKIKDGEVLE